MRSSNMFVLRGRTTADIELKQAGDIPVCNFSIAVDRPYRKDKERETDFIYLTAYRAKAEFLANYVSKGTMIGVTGEIRTRKWEDKDGNNRTSTDFIVDEIEFAGPKSNGTSANDGASVATAAPATSFADDDNDLPF